MNPLHDQMAARVAQDEFPGAVWLIANDPSRAGRVDTPLRSKAPSRMDKHGASSAYSSPPVFPAGTAGLVSTVDDDCAFARMLLNGGSHQGRNILTLTCSVAAAGAWSVSSSQPKASRPKSMK